MFRVANFENNPAWIGAAALLQSKEALKTLQGEIEKVRRRVEGGGRKVVKKKRKIVGMQILK